jgi:hypothetical protein
MNGGPFARQPSGSGVRRAPRPPLPRFRPTCGRPGVPSSTSHRARGEPNLGPPNRRAAPTYPALSVCYVPVMTRYPAKYRETNPPGERGKHSVASTSGRRNRLRGFHALGSRARQRCRANFCREMGRFRSAGGTGSRTGKRRYVTLFPLPPHRGWPELAGECVSPQSFERAVSCAGLRSPGSWNETRRNDSFVASRHRVSSTQHRVSSIQHLRAFAFSVPQNRTPNA